MDGRDDALVDVGDQPRGTCEQVHNSADVDEVPNIGGQEDNKIIWCTCFQWS
jgi:hypothetical protein